MLSKLQATECTPNYIQQAWDTLKWFSSFIEIFSGTAGLCAEVRRHGLLSSVGVDSHVAKRTKSPVLRIHLGEDRGEELLWRILRKTMLRASTWDRPVGRAVVHVRSEEPMVQTQDH